MLGGASALCGAGSALAAVPEEPTVAIARDADRTIITFTGSLLSAESNDGPWALVTNAVSPYVVDTSDGQKFYRASAPSDGSIFAARSVVTLELTGPFQAYFDMAYAGIPDGFIPPVREKPYFDGVLAMSGQTVPVSLRVRGNSNLQECPFPKLKFKVSKEDRPGTPFENAREIKIGTHCADGGHGNIGRLRDQIAAYREVLAYEVMDVAGFVTPRVRRAHIDYFDTTPATNENATVGWQITRDAMLLEDIEVLGQRLNARVLADEELANLEKSSFDIQTLVDLQLFNALIGNWDYSVAWDTRGVWNIDALEFPDGHLVPVAGDFDLASWVTGVVRGDAPDKYHPELAELERETLYDVEQIKGRVDSLNFAAGVARFEQARVKLEAIIASANLDAEGRTNVLRHVSAFYDAVTQLGL